MAKEVEEYFDLEADESEEKEEREEKKEKKEMEERPKNTNPFCLHDERSGKFTVKKEGENKGRDFYACIRREDFACKFFQWADGGRTNKKRKLPEKATKINKKKK